jgi:capsular polysaccharide biosynthesis protein
MPEKEINLVDFIDILLRRKWLIIVPTLIIVILVGIISFILPPKWEVDAIIEPAKFYSMTTVGDYIEVMATEPKQIVELVNKATYNVAIASELNIDLASFPKIKAESPEESQIVHISVVQKDIERAKQILNALVNYIKTDVDTKADIEMGLIEEEIKMLTNKLEITKERIKEIEAEMKEIKSRNKEIEKEQRQNLANIERNETESLALLLYSNKIHENLQYLNTLTELLNEKKLEEEDLAKEINNFEERKGRIVATKLMKAPTPSPSPVFPKKKLNILIALVLGLVIFTIAAFFLEQIEAQKDKS